MMNENLQQQTDVEQAKAKLQEVAETKEARRDPRSQETSLTTLRSRPVTDGRVPDELRDIRDGTTKPKKKTFGQKLKEALLPENTNNDSVGDYVFFRIFVPSIKRLLYDMGCNVLSMTLGVDPRNRPNGGGNTHTANARIYRERTYERSSGQPGGYSRKSLLQDYEWDEETAKDYFNQMLDVAEKYGDLSVSNAYAITGLHNLIRTTDRNWGWTKALMTRADVYPVDSAGTRWMIDLPDPRPLT